MLYMFENRLFFKMYLKIPLFLRLKVNQILKKQFCNIDWFNGVIFDEYGILF